MTEVNGNIKNVKSADRNYKVWFDLHKHKCKMTALSLKELC